MGVVLGGDFVVPFFLALDLSLSSRHQKVINWQLQNDEVFTKNNIIILSILILNEKSCHLTTWEQEVEIQRKKKPQIPRSN
jgi:hypothetical protein